jgi:hypothetical protein
LARCGFTCSTIASKRRRIGDGDLAEHLAVQFDAGAIKPGMKRL